MAFRFGERLKQTLKDKKIYQNTLADRIGVKRQTVGQYISGVTSPKAEILFEICEYLKVSADYLLGNDNTLPDYVCSKIAEEYTGLPFENVELLHAIAVNRAFLASNGIESDYAAYRVYRRQLASAIQQAVHDLAEGGME